MPAIGGDDLRETFGVAEATVVVPPVAHRPRTATPALDVVRYQEVMAEYPPVYLGKALDGQTGDWLVLAVHADAPPDSVVVVEAGFKSVIVKVHAPCAGTSTWSPSRSPTHSVTATSSWATTSRFPDHRHRHRLADDPFLDRRTAERRHPDEQGDKRAWNAI